MAGSGARYFRLVFERFPDRAVERRYRFEQRSRQAVFTVRMIYFGVAGIVGYWVVAFSTLPAGIALGIMLDQVWFLPILLLFGWLVNRPDYPDAWWADIGLFTAVQFPLYRSITRVVATQVTGWPFNTQFCYSLMGAMVFACLTFTAAVRPFFYLTLASVAYLGVILFVHGY